MGAPARRNQKRSDSAACRTRPRSDSADRPTARSASCFGSRPAHLYSRVSRCLRRNATNVVRSSACDGRLARELPSLWTYGGLDIPSSFTTTDSPAEGDRPTRSSGQG